MSQLTSFVTARKFGINPCLVIFEELSGRVVFTTRLCYLCLEFDVSSAW